MWLVYNIEIIVNNKKKGDAFSLQESASKNNNDDANFCDFCFFIRIDMSLQRAS